MNKIVDSVNKFTIFVPVGNEATHKTRQDERIN